MAGETHAPARTINRSVLIAAPIIALMFILGTSSVLAFVRPEDRLDAVRMNIGLQLRIHHFGGQQQGEFAKL